MSGFDALIVLIDRLGGQPVSVVQACLHVLEQLAAGEEVSRHQLGLILDGLASVAPDDEVWDLLLESGLAVRVGRALRLSVDSLRADAEGVRVGIDREDLRALLNPRAADVDSAPPSTPTTLAACVERVQAWAIELLGIAAVEGLLGMPVFWQRDSQVTVPLGRDVGSMATIDVIGCVFEPFRYGWPTLPEVDGQLLRRSWEQILSMGIDDPGDWYDGAITFPPFDDDFVGSFLPELAARGSCPTTEAVANRVFGLVTLSRALGEEFPDLAARSAGAINAGVRCLVRWQDDSGAWANHRYPDGSPHRLAIRDVSTQYAADAITEALSHGALAPCEARAAHHALDRLANFLAGSVDVTPDGASWKGDFVVDDPEARLRTTTLVGLVLGKVAAYGHDELLPLQVELVRHLGAHWRPEPDRVFVSEFRSPTWEGPALAPFAWDMVRDAFVVSAILDCDARQTAVGEDLLGLVRTALVRILDAEYHGSWLDIPMAREGKRRAFASNTLHSLRAVLAAAALDVRSLPGSVVAPR